ncbi:hypothetical protein HN789_01005 [archaeon]|jgi:FMN phosphatase YigB (HAD superfamily)|nr:hypothetical protein [archaeon]MBT4272720.1 hypothetical protein [archaeon]MBT4461519.1 hypothetical protein [archaeon]MBT4857712.1 hypothetical protein [archaeon]MBT5423901.1 hypothetical protein [archaeon]
MIQALILDQDGTVYPPKQGDAHHPLIAEARKRTKQWIIDNTPVEETEIEKVYQSLRENHPHPYEGFPSLGLEIASRQRRGDLTGIPGYHDVLDGINVSDFLEPDPILSEVFTDISRTIPIYIVTLASPGKYSVEIQEVLGIRDSIKATYCPLDFPEDPTNISKGKMYEWIAHQEGISLNEVMVLGDNFTVDLQPAAELGCQVGLVNVNEDYHPEIQRIDLYKIKEVLA